MIQNWAGHRQGCMIPFRLLGVSIDKCIRFTCGKEGCGLGTIGM